MITKKISIAAVKKGKPRQAVHKIIRINPAERNSLLEILIK